MTAQSQRVGVFAEADYRYGAGPLRLKVDRIDWASPIAFEGENWYRVEGVEVYRNGRERGRRQVLVRGSRLGPPPTG